MRLTSLAELVAELEKLKQNKTVAMLSAQREIKAREASRATKVSGG